jgi:hypothetical protein
MEAEMPYSKPGAFEIKDVSFGVESAGDTFVFNVTPGPDDKGDTSIIIDYREGGFTGGVFVASGDISGDAAGLPYIESSLPAVQSEHVVDGFEHTQPLVSGHYTLWDHTFEPPVG